MSCYGIKWHFIPPLSTCWEGMIESMVRLVQRCSKKILLSARIAFGELETVLREIELTLNNRPLSFTYEIGDEIYRLTSVKKSIKTLKIDLFI